MDLGNNSEKDIVLGVWQSQLDKATNMIKEALPLYEVARAKIEQITGENVPNIFEVKNDDLDADNNSDENKKRTVRWTKLELNVLQSSGQFLKTDEWYKKVEDTYDEVMEYDRHTRVARLSSGVNSLRKSKKVKYLEDEIGNKLYGLPSWFDKDNVPQDKFLANLEERGFDLESFGITYEDINDLEF